MGYQSLKHSTHIKLDCPLAKLCLTKKKVKIYLHLLCAIVLSVQFSCTVVKTQHHITLDHNITIKIEKEVNSFLDDLYDDETEN